MVDDVDSHCDEDEKTIDSGIMKGLDQVLRLNPEERKEVYEGLLSMVREIFADYLERRR